MPRLSSFRTEHPEIKLKLVADDSITDLRRDRLDVAVRFGKPPFSDARSLGSMPDAVFPVCSPKLLQAHSASAAQARLLQLPLIASDTVNPTWLTWRSWAQGVGLGPEIGKASDASRLRFNHYTDTIQAAVTGEGVALGWAALLREHLQEGRLLPLGTTSLTLTESYQLLVPAGKQPTTAAQVFLEWMVARFANAI